MQINEMNIQDVDARLAEIENSLETRSGEELEAIKAEVEALQLRKAELLEAEKRQAIAEQLTKGEILPEKIVEERNEVTIMQQNMGIESAEYRSAWLKTLMNKQLTEPEQRAYATTDDHTAIPTLVADKFFEKMKKLAPMLSEITLLRASGNIKFMVEGTRNSAAKHTENSAIATSADTVISVTLSQYEFFKKVSISESALSQSVDGFENWLIEMLSGDMARCIDDYIINDSTNGLAAAAYTTGENQILNTATTGYTYKNIVDLIALLPAAYDAEAKFLVNKKTLYGQIANIVDTNKRPIFVESPEGGSTGRIMGYPVVVDDYVATANNGLYLGKLSDIVGNLSKDINVIKYPDYDHGAVNFRGGAFFDSKLAKNDAIVRLVSTTA